MYSPRSVSTLSMPRSSRNLLRWISSVTMLLLLTSVLQFFAWQMRKISSSACSAVSAQITFAPLWVICASKASSCLSRFSIARHLMFFAFSLARCTLVNCALPTGTTALYREILKLIFLRCSRSAALTVLFAVKEEECSDIIFLFFLHQNVLWPPGEAYRKNLHQTYG